MVEVYGAAEPGGGLKARGCGNPTALRGSNAQARQGTRPQDSLKTGDLGGLRSGSRSSLS